MAKKKANKDEETIVKEFEITGASIKDDFCTYSFSIKSGVGIGDTHNVKGSGIVDPDMHEAFRGLNAHLAAIDDMFKHNGIEVENIDEMHNNPLTDLFSVTGFVIKGSEDNESIILKGNKYLSSTGGRMELETPKIPLDNLSPYQWHNELKIASDKARYEVELYKGGKCTPVEHEEAKDKNQLTIGDAIEDAKKAGIDVEFSNAKM